MMMLYTPLLPYALLGLLVIAVLRGRSALAVRLFIAAQIGLALVAGLVNAHGLVSLGIFWGLCEFHWRNPPAREWITLAREITIVILALGFANHLFSGFHNLRFLLNLKLTISSLPFTLYLNFDKTIAVVVLMVASPLFVRQAHFQGKAYFKETLKIAGSCLAVMIPLVVASSYVHFEPKLPESFWIWAFNNLLFVCFAEEVIFRGIIQNRLMSIAEKWNIPASVPIVTSSLLFGICLLGHLQGGLAYITFSILAGLFYGYAYHKTKRLESAILVHFLLNLCHFLFFSYPAAAVQLSPS